MGNGWGKLHPCAETKILQGNKSDGCGRNASVYHVSALSRITSEEIAECSKGLGGGDFQQLYVAQM